MAEQAGALDDRELGVGEGPDHLAGLRDREERILNAPHELDRDVEATVHVAQVPHVPLVEGAQHLHRRIAASGIVVERPEEELVELAVEQGRIGEGVAEDERVAAESRSTGGPAQSGAEAGEGAGSVDVSLVPARPRRLLGVDQSLGPEAVVLGDVVAGADAPAVVLLEVYMVQLDEVVQAPDALEVLVAGQCVLF